jgi:hypothetical protein
MPPAIIAVAAAVASWGVTQLGLSILVVALLQVAIAVAAFMLTPKPKNVPTLNQGQELALKLDATMTRQFPLGRTATGGSLAWAFTYTDDGNKPNRYLVRIITLSDLPISGLVQLREGTTVLNFAGDITTGLYACTAHQNKSGNSCMWARVYLGSPYPAADSNLMSWSGGQWTAGHKGTNLAYAILKYDFDTDAFPNGEPQLVFVVDGVKVYDDRQDGSKPSRTGNQRVGDSSTWAYSRNCANLTAQLLRGFYSKGVLIAGAQAEDRDLSDSMLLSAYNICDNTITITGGTEPQYRAGMMVSSVDSTATALHDLQAAMDGRIIDRGGSITILPGATRSAIFNLTDDDISWPDEKSWQPEATLSELTNNIVGTYIDEVNGYQEKSFPTLSNAAWETQDGGQRFISQYAFRAVTSNTQAQRITKRTFQATRFQGTVAFVLPLWAIEMEQGDWFTHSSVRNGYTAKWFEVVRLDISTDMKVAIVAREVSTTFGGWTLAEEVFRTDTVGIAGVYGLTTPTISLASYHTSDAASLTESVGIQVTLGGLPSGNAALFVETELALTSSLATAGKLSNLPAINQVFNLTNLLPGTSFSIRVRSSTGQSQSAWTAWTPFVTDTVTNSLATASVSASWANITGDGKPADNATVNDDAENFIINGTLALDAKHYILVGATWTQGALGDASSGYLSFPVSGLVASAQFNDNKPIKLSNALQLFVSCDSNTLAGSTGSFVLRGSFYRVDGSSSLIAPTIESDISNPTPGWKRHSILWNVPADAQTATFLAVSGVRTGDKSEATNFRVSKVEGGATVGAPAGTLVAGRPAADVINDLNVNALNIIQNALNVDNYAAVVDARTFIAGQPVATYLQNFHDSQVTDNAASNSTLSLLGAKNGNGTGFVMNLNTVQVDGLGTTLSTKLDQVSAAGNGWQASVAQLQNAVINPNGSMAKAVLSVNANGRIAGYTATANNQSSNFNILADNFSIVNGTDNSAVTPFSVSGGIVRATNFEADRITYGSLVSKFGGSQNQLNPDFGFQIMPGGLIMQWGRVRANLSGERTYTITFPMAFPNGVMAVSATAYIATFSVLRDLWMQNVGSPTLTQTVFCTQAGTGQDQYLDGFDWVAYGY